MTNGPPATSLSRCYSTTTKCLLAYIYGNAFIFGNALFSEVGAECVASNAEWSNSGEDGSKSEEEVEDCNTNDEEGLQIVAISRNNSLAPGQRSSCVSISAGRENNDGHLSPLMNEEKDLDQMGVHHEDFDHDTISGLSEPTPCALIHAVGGYRVEVAWVQVYPRQFELHTVPIHEECAVVKVELVSDWPDIDLPFPPNDEIFKLGQAVLQRIQWRRRDIVVRPKQGSS
ncbi:hypothetical protein C2845_PM17G05760 [Panicum miliaceum]|uniref:DUF8039 domain-containing protein n=1 Tax=Panicum miliaceum TaxID=4540 RepID=A0A3L6Q3M7_PANMI|nr:hypothetical protein C2845_PM17G05760 [Panicum miliaceum]